MGARNSVANELSTNINFCQYFRKTNRNICLLVPLLVQGLHVSEVLQECCPFLDLPMYRFFAYFALIVQCIYLYY